MLPVGADNHVSPVLLPLLRAFDPDDVMLHELTLADLAYGSPDKVNEAIGQYRHDGESRDDTWARIGGTTVDYHQDVSAGLAAQVGEWCSPLQMWRHDENNFAGPNLHTMRRAEDPGGHLSLLPATGKAIIDLDLSTVDPVIALMIESRVGTLAAADRVGLHVIDLPVLEEDLPGIIATAITGKVSWDWKLSERFQRATGVAVTSEPPSALPADVYLASTPSARTRVGLVKVSTPYPRPAAYVVIGDAPEDHALSLLCDRLFQHGCWIPLSLLDTGSAYRKPVERALWALNYQVGSGSVIQVVSVSMDFADLTTVVAGLRRGDNVPGFDMVPAVQPRWQAVRVEMLLDDAGWSQLADQRWFNARRAMPCREIAGELLLLTPIETATPSATDDLGDDLQWCVDVMVPGYQAPARSAVSTSMLTQSTGGFPEAMARVARYGVSFSSINMGFVPAGGPAEGRVARPLLRLPSAEQIFDRLAAVQGATIERSTAGRRAANAIDMWGSLTAISADLAGSVRSLLDSFSPPPGAANGSYGGGYNIRKKGYLTLQHAAAALGGDEMAARTVLDRLLMIGVLRRGMVLGCQRCGAQDFYRLGAVDDAGFVCSVCGHLNQLTHSRWDKGVGEPAWHYALDQVVRDLLAQHGDVPLLAAAALRSGNESMLWAPEQQLVFSDGQGAELDLALIVGGRIVVGEAKSNNQLKTGDKGTTQAAARLVRAACVMSADEIVLATSKRNWASGVREAVEAAVATGWSSGHRPRVREMVDVGISQR
jgi:hypothetical protein